MRLDGDGDCRYQVADDGQLSALTTRLGLERYVDVGLTLVRAEVIGDELRLHLEWESVGGGRVRLSSAGKAGRFCGTRNISVTFEGGGVGRAFAVLMRRMAVSLGDASIEDVLGLFVHADGETGDATESRRADTDVVNHWNPDDSWRSFLCGDAMHRKLFDSFSFDGPMSYIVHGDLECRFISPFSPVSLPRFFNYPWPLTDDDAGGVRRGAHTDLRDIDVIRGGEEKLDRALSVEVEEIGGAGPVFVNHTCVPMVIGEDVERIIDRHRAGCPHGIHLVSPRTRDPSGVLLDNLITTRDEAIDEHGRGREGCVALIGFPEDRARGELTGLLNDAGIEVAGAMLPRVSRDLVRTVMSARVLVFRPSEYHDDFYEGIFGGTDRVMISPEAPWGRRRATDWVTAVADAVGMAAEAKEVLARKCQPPPDPVVGDCFLGFVIDPGQEGRLIEPDSGSGLPVLPVVAEMGFSTRVLVYSADQKAFEESRERLAGVASDGRPIEVLGFDSPAGLFALLREPDLRGVFSEYFFDRRLSRHGKGQFRAGDFEMGLQGAARTRRRLENLLDVPFYREYAGRLSGTTEVM